MHARVTSCSQTADQRITLHVRTRTTGASTEVLEWVQCSTIDTARVNEYRLSSEQIGFSGSRISIVPRSIVHKLSHRVLPDSHAERLCCNRSTSSSDRCRTVCRLGYENLHCLLVLKVNGRSDVLPFCEELPRFFQRCGGEEGGRPAQTDSGKRDCHDLGPVHQTRDMGQAVQLWEQSFARSIQLWKKRDSCRRCAVELRFAAWPLESPVSPLQAQKEEKLIEEEAERTYIVEGG